MRSLLFIALGHLALELSNNFLPVVYPLFISSLGLTYSQIGIIAFVVGLSASLMQPLFGYLSDRWYPHLIAALSIAWSGVIMGLVGLAWGYLPLLLIVGLGALGSAAFHPSGATIASASGSARRGAAVSVFSVGGTLGTALSPLWVTFGIAWLGMRGTSVVIPVALAASLLPYWQMKQAQHPGSRRIIIHSDAMKNWSPAWLVLIIVAMMFRSWFQVSLTTYLPTWIQAQGRSVSAGGQMLFVLLAPVGVGSLIGGALSDRIGRWQVLALSMSLLGPAEWAFLGSSNLYQIALLAVTGALMGMTYPVSIVLAQEVWPRGMGVAAGLVMGLPWVGGGIGAALTGLVADHFSLTVALQGLVLPAMMGAVCVLGYAALRQTQMKPESQC